MNLSSRDYDTISAAAGAPLRRRTWGGGWSPYDETEFPNRESDRKQERRGGRGSPGRVLAVKLEYGLTVDPPERDALDAMLKGCRIERGATARPTGAVPMRPDAQLLLFDPDAPPARPGASTPPRARGREGAAPGAIPAKCPVVGKPVCYRQDCRHWSNGCAHPEARATAAR